MKHLERLACRQAGTFIGGGLLAATIGAGMVLEGGKSQSGGFDNNPSNTTDTSFTNNNTTKAEIVMDAGEILFVAGAGSVILGMRKPGKQRSTFQP